MGRMIFDLTDEDRAALEQLRAARGLRSQAEVLRALIRENTAGGEIILGVVETPAPRRVVDLGKPVDPATPKVIKGVTSLPRPNAAKFGERLKKR